MHFQSLHFWGEKTFSSCPLPVSHATNQSLALIFPEVFLFFRQHAGLRLSSEFDHSQETGPFPRNGVDIQNSEKFFLVKNVALGSCDKIFYIYLLHDSICWPLNSDRCLFHTNKPGLWGEEQNLFKCLETAGRCKLLKNPTDCQVNCSGVVRWHFNILFTYSSCSSTSPSMTITGERLQ